LIDSTGKHSSIAQHEEVSIPYIDKKPSIIYFVNENGEVKNGKTNRFLKGVKTKNGYLRVSIGGKYIRIHRLVAEAFIEKENGKTQGVSDFWLLSNKGRSRQDSEEIQECR
jgi:hypothetical protein